jgi:drug/metabolite transporter (DMT)-like permease
MLRNWKASPVLALLAMVAITAIWGWTFLIVQDAVSRMPVMDFLSVRFMIASAAMLAVRPVCLRGINKQGYLRGIILGGALAMGYILQTFGLQHTSATVSGFITGMFMVLTPVLSWVILRRKTGKAVWLAVGIATIGLALLSLRGWSMGWGELLTLGCAFFFALHIMGLGEWSPGNDAYGLAWLQITTVAVITLLASSPGGVELPPDGIVWMAVFITSILATAAAFYVQTWAQSLISPTRMGVTMTMEPVFAGIFGVMLGGDKLSTRIILGAVCVLAAMLLSGWQDRKSPVHLSLET